MSVWLVTRWEYLIRVRSKLFLLSTFLVPLLLLGIVFVPLTLIKPEPTAGMTYLVVGGPEVWGEEIEHYLDKSLRGTDGMPLFRRYSFAVGTRAESEQLAELLLQEGIVDACLMLPDDFPQSGRVEYHSRVPGKRAEEEQLRRAVQAVWLRVQLEKHRVDPMVIEGVARGLQWSRQSPAGETAVSEADVWRILAPIMYVLILFFAIFMASQMLMRSIITERGNRIIELLLSSISAKDLMTGKVLGLGLVGLTQLAVYLLAAGVIGGIAGVELIRPEPVGYFLIYAILGYFFFAGVFAALGSMFETEQEAQQVAGLLSLIPILPVVFSVYVMANPEALLVRIASFIPPLTPFLMIIRLAVSQVRPWELVGTTAILALFTIFMMRWAGSIFRVTILHPGSGIRFAWFRSRQA